MGLFSRKAPAPTAASANNPYVNGTTDIADVPEYGYQDYAAYAAGDVPAPYTRPGNPYSDQLKPQIGSTPDPMRERNFPIRSYRINPATPDLLYQQLDADKAQRESVGHTREQWQEMVDPSAAMGANRWAPNPRTTPPVPTRKTSTLAPTNYRYVRTDGQNGGTPRRLNGNHWSLADHTRAESISQLYGVMPLGRTGSSQRLDVMPWGTNVVRQNQQTTYPNATESATPSPIGGGTRAYRLG